MSQGLTAPYSQVLCRGVRVMRVPLHPGRVITALKLWLGGFTAGCSRVDGRLKRTAAACVCVCAPAWPGPYKGWGTRWRNAVSVPPRTALAALPGALTRPHNGKASKGNPIFAVTLLCCSLAGLDGTVTQC